MSFFEHQERSRRRSGRLVALFMLAVALIIASLYVVVAVVLHKIAGGHGFVPATWWQPRLVVAVTVGAGLFIGLSSLLTIAQLRRGGAALASKLGGRAVDPATDHEDERRLLDLVERVCVASGTPVPAVFVLDGERGMNAFAAGQSPHDAAVAVTRGCLDVLDGDELEAVLAHEVSHILNGDMRLQTRLVGVVSGILTLSTMGTVFLRGSEVYAQSNTRDREGTSFLRAMGAALVVIGFFGMVVARLIKLAVGRERELLADASAAQLTGNPAGLASALKKMAGFQHGTKIAGAYAEEASHLFFAHALGSSLLGDLFSSHPPIEERIRRLDPALLAPLTAVPRLAAQVGGLVDLVGAPDARHLTRSVNILADLPVVLREAARRPVGAAAIVYGLLLQRQEPRARQLEILRQRESPAVAKEVVRLLPVLGTMPLDLRLPLLDLAMPALRRLAPERGPMLRVLESLVKVDGRMTVFDFALVRTVARRLDAAAGFGRPVHLHGLRDAAEEVSLLLSALAFAGHGSDRSTAAAFQFGVAKLPDSMRREVMFLPVDECTASGLDRALDSLARAMPAVQELVLEACGRIARADERVTLQEADLLRVVAAALDCPVPPFLPAVEEENSYALGRHISASARSRRDDSGPV